MPVTIKPNAHPANAFNTSNPPANDDNELLKGVSPPYHARCADLLGSSFKEFDAQKPVFPNPNGFVQGAIDAYNNHYHLCIRPDDVWLAILTQLILYINANAEQLRSKFVAFEGKKELVIKLAGSRHTVDYTLYVQLTADALEENKDNPEMSLVDKEFKEWMMPAFSTTTRNDITVASVVMMGAMKKYFDFTCELMCGLPSVTLLGERSDWQKMLAKLEKLKDFGDETTQWSQLLHPIISRFVLSFDSPDSPETNDFWSRIAHNEWFGSGGVFYSGWITAFCFWNEEGKSMYYVGDKSLRLDGVGYHEINANRVPPGYLAVPVKIIDHGLEIKALCIAGSVGVRCSSSWPNHSSEKPVLDTLQAESGWWMIELTETDPWAERDEAYLAEEMNRGAKWRAERQEAEQGRSGSCCIVV